MQNLLKGTRCYLIGHIQYADGQWWRNKIKDDLKETGIHFFDPYHKPFLNGIEEGQDAQLLIDKWREEENWDALSAFMHQIRIEDLRLCDIVDMAIVYIDPKVPSWGSAEELTTITRSKKPTFIVVEQGVRACPLWVLGMVPYHYIYSSLDECVKMVKNIDNGTQPIDSTRWRILKEQYR